MTQWLPRFGRDLARDVDYLDRLPPAERDWLERFLAEYYAAEPHGISRPEHIAESNRRNCWAARNDVWSRGLRASGEMPDVPAFEQDSAPSALDAPEAQALLAELRALRPKHDPADGRKRAVFASKRAERRFYRLRDRLRALLAETKP